MINRRSLLVSSASLALGAAVLPLAASQAEAYTLARIPATRQRSYGPNGTHWPAHTPRTGFRRDVTVACSWTAIASAIRAVSQAQAGDGVIIRVRPGTLRGDNARDVLSRLGSYNFKKNILVTPRDGYGTVTMTGTVRLRDVRGITFARFIAHNVRMVDCARTAWAQTKLTYGMRFYASRSVITRCDGYELVMPNSRVNAEDAFSYSAGSGSTLTNCLLEGCYSAPVFRPSGSSAHLDTFQMFGSGSYRGLTIRDSVFFGSNNCALQIGGYSARDPRAGSDFLVLDHSIIMSQEMAVRTRFPRPSGGTGNGSQAINGGGEPGQLSAINGTYVLGSMYTTQWKRVSGSYTSNQPSVRNNRAASGQWTYQSDLGQMTSRRLTSMAPVPTDAYLRSIWT